MRSHLRLLAALVALALALASGGAHADERSNADVDARFAAIDAALARGEGASRLWWTGWTLGYAGLTAGQGTLALVTHDRGTRVDAIVGGAGSLLGLAGMLTSSRAAFTARGTLAEMDARTPGERALRLKRAEELLEDAADAERFQHSIWAHLGAAGVNLGGSFVLWLGYRRYASGWINLLAGTTLAELQIVSQPTDALDAWNDYRRGRLSRRTSSRTFSLSLAPLPTGVVLFGRF